MTTVPDAAGSTIASVLVRDPSRHPLANNGQARIPVTADGKTTAELRGELETFVCEGQYADGLVRILGAYLSGLGKTSQKGTWVSGFFGSGKSHLLKMLCHLWANTTFPDGRVARDLVPALPEDLRAHLRELDTAGRRAGGLLACAGAMPSGNTDRVRLTILAVILRGVGLPEQWTKAEFCLWLHDRGWFDTVRTAVEATGKQWDRELDNLHVSDPIPRALLTCDSGLAATPGDVRKLLASQFPVRTSDLSTAEFLTACRRALARAGRGGRLPCTLVVLDEVQQFIGDSSDRSVLITEAIEALSKQFDSQLMVVAAGQSALTAVPLLAKLMDRCTIRVPLSDADVETVTRRVLLQKQPAALPQIRALLDLHAGELSRQLQGTRIGEHATDRAIAADDYPLLPVRRRFWELCFRQVDAAGTSSQLRSQLRIIYDAIARLADRSLGALVPGDELFDALAPEMVNTGVLLRELNERIIGLDRDGGAAGRLQRRLAGLVFLIARLPRDAAIDSGVRASAPHLADLVVEDLAADNARLRQDVAAALEVMTSAGVLMRIEDEYRLQTRAGADWDREFRTRQARLGGDEAAIQLRRDELLYGEFARVVAGLRIRQGVYKQKRDPIIVRDPLPPRIGDQVPLWVRDAFSANPADVVDALRAAGGDSPLIGVVLPRSAADALRSALIDADAAQQTWEAKPVAPDDGEGIEARKGMESRRDLARARRDRMITEIVSNAKVYQGGGTELLQATLDEKLRAAMDAALSRLFPRFREADATASAWEAVIRRAREGGDQPLQPVDHHGPTEAHPVCQQVLTAVGAGSSGGDLRRILAGPPYGWPQDAIDATLIALHRSQHLGALLNGASLPPGQLDQAKLGKAEFRVERHVLGVTDRLALRKLFQALDLNCRSADEVVVIAPTFVAQLGALAATAGGDAPLPLPPATGAVAELTGRIGTDLLAALLERTDVLTSQITAWKASRDLAAVRMPAWRVAEQLARHCACLPTAAAHVTQFEAIRTGRLLLAATDPVPPVRAALATALRASVVDAHNAHIAAATAAGATLDASPLWQRLDTTRRIAVLAEVGLNREPVAPVLPDDSALLTALEARPLMARQADADAVAGRAQRALTAAARLLEPNARSVSVERATLTTPEEVHAWTERQQQVLLAAIAQGPVVVQ